MDFYHKAIKEDRIEFGLCCAFATPNGVTDLWEPKPPYNVFYELFDPNGMEEKEDHPFWAYGKPHQKGWFWIEAQEFSSLRQNIVLLCAAANGEEL